MCFYLILFILCFISQWTGELFDKIIENTTKDGCFSEVKSARIIKSILEAVSYLHANEIVHRDIKPENILFESDSEDSAVKLIDFGLSRRHQRGQALMTNPVGTAYYMSPEREYLDSLWIIVIYFIWTHHFSYNQSFFLHSAQRQIWQVLRRMEYRCRSVHIDLWLPTFQWRHRSWNLWSHQEGIV